MKTELIKKYQKAKLHFAIGESMKNKRVKFNKQRRKRDYYIRRGLKAETRLTQLRSIPFLAKV